MMEGHALECFEEIVVKRISHDAFKYLGIPYAYLHPFKGNQPGQLMGEGCNVEYALRTK